MNPHQFLILVHILVIRFNLGQGLSRSRQMRPSDLSFTVSNFAGLVWRAVVFDSNFRHGLYPRPQVSLGLRSESGRSTRACRAARPLCCASAGLAGPRPGSAQRLRCTRNGFGGEQVHAGYRMTSKPGGWIPWSNRVPLAGWRCRGNPRAAGTHGQCSGTGSSMRRIRFQPTPACRWGAPTGLELTYRISASGGASRRAWQPPG